MSKIKKNLPDSQMFVGCQETKTFENSAYEEVDLTLKKTQPLVKQSLAGEFLTPQLQEQVGKALLALKLKLYKEGIIDYKIKVITEKNQIILKAVPEKNKKQECTNKC